jgi:hypothetical protein
MSDDVASVMGDAEISSGTTIDAYTRNQANIADNCQI